MKRNVFTRARTGSRARLRAAVAAALLACAAPTLAQQPDLAQAEELVRAGRFAEAYQLLEPFEDRMAGDLKFDYLLARAALESGKPSKASFIYERILAIEPNYVGVRLEMGRAYLALQDYGRAKLEFETVLRFDNLPPDLREQAQIYARAADQALAGRRLVGYGYAEYSFGYDSNPLSATKRSAIEVRLPDGSIGILDLGSLSRSDHYNAVALGGEGIYALDNRFSLYAGADGRSRWYNDVDVASFYTLDGRIGLGYAEGRANARLGLVAGRYWLDNTTTRDTWGLTGDLRYLLDNRDQLSFSAGAARFQFVPDALKINDYDLYQGAVGWLRVVNDGRGAIGLTLNGGTEDATRGRTDGDKPFLGARLTLQNAFTDSVGGFVLAGASQGWYSDVNPSFDVKRRDTLYDVTAGITWSFAAGWSLRPQIVYVKNASNIDLYEFDRTDISINVRRDF